METAIYQSGCGERPAKRPWVRFACPSLCVSARRELRVGCGDRLGGTARTYP